MMGVWKNLMIMSDTGLLWNKYKHRKRWISSSSRLVVWFQEQNKRLKEEEEEMKRSMTYLSLLDKHEQAAKKRNMKAAREQIVCFYSSPQFHVSNFCSFKNCKKILLYWHYEIIFDIILSCKHLFRYSCIM